MRHSVIARSFGTHDGSFHADEVTACSLLLLFGLIDRGQIKRTRDPKELAMCDYVCDVGNLYHPQSRRFDHHQVDYKGPLSSAGMILLYLKEQGILDAHLYDHFNRTLVLGVDAHDTGVARIEWGTTTFSQVVSNFLPVRYGASAEEMREAFLSAVDFVVGHLDRLKQRFYYALECQSIVKQVMAGAGYSLVFDQAIPWMDSFFELEGERHPAQFLIMPSGEHWKLRGIPPTLNERMKVRRLLPKTWAGFRDEELKKISGVQGAVFCHKGRFISIWETKEDALKALHLALEQRDDDGL